MGPQIDIAVVEAQDIDTVLKDEMLRLQIACFASQVTAQEVEEDFDRPSVAAVIARYGGELIACAEIFQRRVTYGGQQISLGGFGPCTRADWRGQGIGTRVCRAAMDDLAVRGCDILFLSVDTNRDSWLLYERLGFKMLPRPFLYANIHGQVKESDGGMVAPLCSPALFERLLQEDEPLNLGPEPGYW